MMIETTCRGKHKEIIVYIRPMIRRDRDDVQAIERCSFEFPWGEAEFQACFTNPRINYLVAEYREQILGYVFYEMLKNHIHLMSIAVHPKYRRMGVGTQLLAGLVGEEYASFEVRETNLAAQLFFRSNGAKATEVLRGFYQDAKEDAYLMKLSLTS